MSKYHNLFCFQTHDILASQIFVYFSYIWIRSLRMYPLGCHNSCIFCMTLTNMAQNAALKKVQILFNEKNSSTCTHKGLLSDPC